MSNLSKINCDAIMNPDISYLEENITHIGTITIKWVNNFKKRQSILEKRTIECYRIRALNFVPRFKNRFSDDFLWEYFNMHLIFISFFRGYSHGP